MNWKTNDNKNLIYVFNYDNLSRLTSTIFSQVSNLLTNNSEVSSYHSSGNMSAIQCYDLGIYAMFGFVYNLTMNYNGNS